MAQIQITAAQVMKKAEELKAKNEEFKSQMNTLKALNQQLMSMYEGEASKAFDKDFQNGEVKLQNFYNAIARYAQVLQDMTTDHIRTEAANVELINARK